MRASFSPISKHASASKRWPSDLTPLYFLMAAGWFAAAFLPAVAGRWLAIDTGGLGIAVGCLCLAHAIFESSRGVNFSMTGLHPFAERCAMPKGRCEFFNSRAEWGGHAAA